MANAANLNDDCLDFERATKAVNRIKNRTSELSSTSEKSGSGSRAAFQRTRYAATEDERVYKTYSTGTAATQVKYEGHELRLIEDEEPDADQPSTSGNAEGLSVKIASLKSRAVRKGHKKTDSHTKIASTSNHARHRPTNDSDESVAKTNVEAMQITRLKEDRGTTDRQFSPQRKS